VSCHIQDVPNFVDSACVLHRYGKGVKIEIVETEDAIREETVLPFTGFLCCA
jgi:hypothetical protein